MLSLVTVGLELPDGTKLERQGITPDVPITAGWLDVPEADDPYILAALDVLGAGASPSVVPSVAPSVVPSVARRWCRAPPVPSPSPRAQPIARAQPIVERRAVGRARRHRVAHPRADAQGHQEAAQEDAAPVRRGSLALLFGLLTAASIAPSAPVSAAPPQTAPADASRPDIVMLMVDDLPEIERLDLAAPAHDQAPLPGPRRPVHPVRRQRSVLCCPGRANVLTGQWSHHHGVITNDGRLFDPRETIATELHDVGYWTGIFGKYFNRNVSPSRTARRPAGTARS